MIHEQSVSEDKAVLRAIRRGDFKDCYLIYNRKSTDEADSQKNSIVYQSKETRSFASRADLKVADMTHTGFCRAGIISEKHSGFKESGDLVFSKQGLVQYQIDRPKFLQMAQFLSQNYFKGVICLCWDRISRNKGDDTVLRKLMRSGVDVRFVLADYDQSSSGELHMDIDGMFAQHHSRVTSEKVRLVTQAKRAEGKCTYRAPIGYLNQGSMDHKPIDPARGPIIKDLFMLYATGDWSLSDLARYAAKQGCSTVPTRRPRSSQEMLADDDENTNLRPKSTQPLRVNHISKILRNPFYLGQIIGPNGAHIPSTSHDALIDAATFMRVQTLLKSKRTSVHYTEKLDHPFRGFARCAQCRRVYTPYEKKGILYFNVRCAPGCKNTLKNCNFTHIAGAVRQLLEQLQFTQAELDELDARSETELCLIEEQKAQAETRRVREQGRIREELSYLRSNQVSLLKSGLYTPEALLEERTKLEIALQTSRNETDADEAALSELTDDVLKISELLNMALCLVDLAKPTEIEAIGKTMVSELLIDQNTFDFIPQIGFAPLFKRGNSFSGPKDWFSELNADECRQVIDRLAWVKELDVVTSSRQGRLA